MSFLERYLVICTGKLGRRLVSGLLLTAVMMLSLSTLPAAHGEAVDPGEVAGIAAIPGLQPGEKAVITDEKGFFSLPPPIFKRGGLALLFGHFNDYKLVEGLLEQGPWNIHWLMTDEHEVARARQYFLANGVYGQVVVELWRSANLPFADHLLNLIVLGENRLTGDRNELFRTLAPGGSILLEHNQQVLQLVRDRPEAMGEWTHAYHDASGNMASHDRAFGVPDDFQWISGPPVPFSHRKDSSEVILSSGGRVFQVTSNVVENFPGGGSRYLVARDAFNGSLLWSRAWEGPHRRHRGGGNKGIVVGADRIYVLRYQLQDSWRTRPPRVSVAVIDAATGTDLEVWSLGSRSPERADGPGVQWNHGSSWDKLLLSQGYLIVSTPAGLTALDTESGEVKWHSDLVSPWNAVVFAGRIFCLSSTRDEDGIWLHELLGLELATGNQIWRQSVESQYGSRNTADLRLHFAADNIVCLLERESMRILSAQTGRELWRRESGTRSRGGMDSRQVGHFLVDGQFWYRVDRGRGRDGPEGWLVLDPQTGEEVRKMAVRGDKGVVRIVDKVGCQPMTATRKMVFDARLSTVWDFASGQRAGWKFARGGCQIGMVPANGLGYAAPNACGCLGEQLRGNLAIVQTNDPGITASEPGSLEPGPAYQALDYDRSVDGDHDQWPTFRRDGRRSAFLPGYVPASPKVAWRSMVAVNRQVDQAGEWRLKFGQPLTASVAASGMVLLAEPQTHQVVALAITTGQELWRFTAAGRVTVPPTIYRDLVLFGAHDGYVYALRVEDGQLAWRLRAAPSDRRIMAYGQVESAWPVTGGVLVHDGLALVVAGRTGDGGGGALVHAIEPATGMVRWSARVRDARHGKPDLLVSDGREVYLMNQRIDPRTGEITEIPWATTAAVREWQQASLQRVDYPEGVRYLRSGLAGFLETAWTRQAMALRKHLSSWSWGDSEGELLAFNDQTGFAFQIDAGSRMWSDPKTEGGGRVEARSSETGKIAWQYDLPARMQVEAMLVTDSYLFISGPQDRAEPGGKGFLYTIDLESGVEKSFAELPSAPVVDGLSAAGGKLLVTLEDGSVIGLH